MAFPSITYTFANGEVADPGKVNQNFTDLVNGLSDGSKALNIAALTCTTFTGVGAMGITGAVTCTGLRVTSSNITDQLVLSVGRSTAESGTFVRDTSSMNNIVSDAGTLTDDAVMAIDVRPSANIGIVGYGYIGWGAVGAGAYSVLLSLSYDSNSGTFTATATGTGAATFDDDNTDSKMCLYIASGDLVLKNRLGSTKKVSYHFVLCPIPTGS